MGTGEYSETVALTARMFYDENSPTDPLPMIRYVQTPCRVSSILVSSLCAAPITLWFGLESEGESFLFPPVDIPAMAGQGTEPLLDVLPLILPTGMVALTIASGYSLTTRPETLPDSSETFSILATGGRL